MRLDKKTVLKIVLWSVAAPILLNILVSIPSRLTPFEGDTWLGFFGNYSGGIIGGIVAFIIASSQIKAQNEEQTKSDIENSRSYIILEEFKGPVDLKNVVTHQNSKILSNDYYKEIKKNPNSKGKHITFYKIHHSGAPEIILDCDIQMVLFAGDQTGAKKAYLIESHLSVLEKHTEIFVPITNIDYTVIYPKQVTISYKTIKNETIIYKYNLEKSEEKHILVNWENRKKDKTLYKVQMKPVEWIYPAKLKRNIVLKK
jgi:hypothetical protein